MTTHSWSLQCLSSVFNPNGKDLVGDNIIVPQRILEEVEYLERASYQFVIKNETRTGTHTICCRVEEFCSGDEMVVYVPDWIMQNLYTDDNEIVVLSLMQSELGKAKKVVIQPHDSLFLTLDDHKGVLENSLRRFSSLTKGTSIMIKHDNEPHSLSVIDTDPTHQYVSLIDTDLEVEFMPPLDYVEVKPHDWPSSEQWPLDPGVYITEEIRTSPKEYVLSDGKRVVLKPPTPPPAPAPVPTQPSAPNQGNKFVAFSGKGHRLTD